MGDSSNPTFASSQEESYSNSSRGSNLGVPPYSQPGRVLGWAQEAVQEGTSFLKQQIGYDKIDDVVDQIMSVDAQGSSIAPIPSDLCQLKDNEMGSIFARLSSALTDVKPFWVYTTANPIYQPQATILGKLSRFWWLNSHADMRLFDTAQYSLAGGTGYYYLTWNPFIEDIEAQALHPHNVLPIRPRDYYSLQSCEAVVFQFDKTINELEARWPDMKGRFKPTRELGLNTPGEQNFFTRMAEAANIGLLGAYRAIVNRVAKNFLPQGIPATTLSVIYLNDRTRNTGMDDILMGPWSPDGKTPERNWSYRVKPGQLLYPRRRVIVATPDAVIYDGPNNYLHGMVPAGKMTLDPRPFPRCWFGKGAMWDVAPFQRELDEVRRAIGDHIRKAVTPDVIVDRAAGLSDAEINQIDPRRPGMIFKRRLGSGEGIHIVYPDPLLSEVLTYPDILIERMNSISGAQDMTSVLRAQQVPSQETVDRFADLSSGITRARSRAAESFVRDIARMQAFNFPQFYTLAQRLQIAGAAAATYEDFNYQPGDLVPDFMGEDFTAEGALRQERRDAGPRPFDERINDFLRGFVYTAEPSSLLASASVSEQMKYLMLWRGGIMDPWTLWEKMGIPNVGEPPLGADTITKRMQAAMAMGMVGQVSAAGRKAQGKGAPEARADGNMAEPE